ncbi:MAG: ABC transporter permease subunit [Alphaproteobacteria bacterium]|nr:ABC transporter permease subunit [Alphaproteobacteria bacterium]
MSARSPAVRLRRAAAATWVGLAFAFLFAPLVVVIGASLDGGERTFLNFPPQHPSLHWYTRISPDLFEALGISIVLGLTTAFIACLLGVPAALGLVRAQFRGKAIVAALFRAPLQIPAVVVGVSFLKLYYSIGGATDTYLGGTLAGLVIAHVFLATPYVIGTVSAVLQRFNLRLEEAALSLGATRWRTFRRVTLPVIMPGVYAGGMYAFLISFGDVPVSLFLGAGDMQPFAAKIFHLMEFDFDPTLLAISTLIIFGSLGAIYLLQRAVGLETLSRSGGGN